MCLATRPFAFLFRRLAVPPFALGFGESFTKALALRDSAGYLATEFQQDFPRAAHYRGWHRRFCGVTCTIFFDMFAKSPVCRRQKRIAKGVSEADNRPMSKRRIYDDELHAQFVSYEFRGEFQMP